MGIGGGELLVIIVVILLLFGSNKMPDLARSLGKGINEFKRATDEIKQEIYAESEKIKSEINETPAPPKGVIRDLKNSVSTTDGIEEVNDNSVMSSNNSEMSSNKKSIGRKSANGDNFEGSGI